MTSVSSVKNLPANAIKISAVILNLASDKPDSDENRKRTLRDHKTNRDTSRETSLQCKSQKKKENSRDLKLS